MARDTTDAPGEVVPPANGQGCGGGNDSGISIDAGRDRGRAGGNSGGNTRGGDGGHSRHAGCPRHRVGDVLCGRWMVGAMPDKSGCRELHGCPTPIDCDEGLTEMVSTSGFVHPAIGKARPMRRSTRGESRSSIMNLRSLQPALARPIWSRQTFDDLYAFDYRASSPPPTLH